MKALICRLRGHKPTSGPLHASPYTVYTHWHDVTCSRCSKLLWTERDYIDARSPEPLYEWVAAGARMINGKLVFYP